MARIPRLLLATGVAAAGALAAASPAPAATDGTSNTLMTASDRQAVTPPVRSEALSFTAIEFKNTGLAYAPFMDYTDDA